MNPSFHAAVRTLVEQVLAEKSLVTRGEVQKIVSEAVAAEFGESSDAVPAAPSAPTVVKAQPQTNGRKPAQTQEERKAKRAAYQRKYRAQQKDKKIGPAPKSSSKPTAPEKPVKNGVAHLPPPISYVPAVDFDL